MASRQGTVNHLLEQAASAGGLSARTMFGKYGLYRDGTLVAFACDDELFVKPTPAGRAFVGEVVEKPLYPGAKPCFLIPGERREDREWLAQLIRVSAAELPAPVTRRRRRS